MKLWEHRKKDRLALQDIAEKLRLTEAVISIADDDVLKSLRYYLHFLITDSEDKAKNSNRKQPQVVFLPARDEYLSLSRSQKSN